jgi:hypothetical protein
VKMDGEDCDLTEGSEVGPSGTRKGTHSTRLCHSLFQSPPLRSTRQFGLDAHPGSINTPRPVGDQHQRNTGKETEVLAIRTAYPVS